MLVAAAAASMTFASGASAQVSADFSWSPAEPNPGETVTFSAQTSDSVKQVQWDLDADGRFDDGIGASVTHVFASAGAHVVRMKAVAGNDQTTTREHTVRVSSGLQAGFSWSPSAPTTADHITLTSTSSVRDGVITAYDWDLDGDGAYDDASGVSVAHAFAAAGEYRVGLRVSDSTGMQASAVHSIPVAAPGTVFTPLNTTGAQWLDPFPSVRIRGRATRGGVHLSLVATRAPLGTAMKVRCRGRRCPKRRVTAYTFKRARLRLHGHERFYTAGTVLEFFIWKSGMVGKYTRFEMRRSRPPRRIDRCLYPGGKWPGACPR